MRYLIGIDLGTTNSCVAYVDTQHPQAPVQQLAIPQLIAAGTVEPRPMLPSFCYLAQPGEWVPGALSLPWASQRSYCVGALAQEHGARVPTRLVASAKSWLCHSAAARRDPLLPTSGDPAIRLSPVEASSRYLAHIAEAWNWSLAKGSEDTFEQQEVILTVPASFDEVARALTAEAAKKAGYGAVTILEEPQAAFYCWIDAHHTTWQRDLTAGDIVLVCDSGGGTTDFSLIAVTAKGEELSLQRIAVGDHLLLGGDNIDAAIAHALVEKAFADLDLTAEQWLQLCHQARLAKEQLLGRDKERFRLTLPGTGSKVVKGSLSVTITRQELLHLACQGFFAIENWDEALCKKPTPGIRTMGLPYEHEPSITKHLAAFLAAHGEEGKPIQPTHILFNGGTLKPRPFQEAILTACSCWFGATPKPLISPHFDSAVARGAAYYGKVRRGLGVRIGGGTPRSYYLAVQIPDGSSKEGSGDTKALTLLPRGAEEGATYMAESTLLLTPNAPVAFDLYTSHTRLHDQSGDLVTLDPEELHRLPPIRTVLRYGKQGSAQPVPVHLNIALTPIGTLEIWLQSTSSSHRWNLEFQLKSASGQEDSLRTVGEGRSDVTYDSAYCQPAIEVLTQSFTPGSGIDPKTVPELLEQALGLPRKQWPPSVLRALWTPLLAAAPHRTLSSTHAERWWHLAGWLLRPGYGYPLDDFRIRDLWKIILAELKKPKAPEILIQQLICLRRIAGGLSRGQQTQAAAETIAVLLPSRGKPLSDDCRRQASLYAERLRTLAAFEWLDSALKVRLATALNERIVHGQASSAELWALGRLAARHLAYAPISCVIPSPQCSSWLEGLINSRSHSVTAPWIHLVGQMARLTGHREIDLPQTLRERLLSRFAQGPEAERLTALLTTVQTLNAAEEERNFGEALPPGLTLSLSIE